MPINPSIPMSFRPPQVQQRDPIQQMAQIEQLKEYRRKSDTRNKLQQALQGSMGPDGAVDYSQVEKAYLQAGDPEGALKMRQGQASLKASETSSQKNQYEILMKKAQGISNAFSGVKNENDFNNAVRYMVDGGFWTQEDAAQFGPYDPDKVAQSVNGARTIESQLKEKFDKQRLDQGERRAAATERSARATANRASTAAAAAREAGYSARTQLFNNGVTLAFNNQGDRIVIGPDNNRLEGEAARQALASGVESGVSEQYDRARARSEAKDVTESTNAAYDALNTAADAIVQYEKVLDAIEEGAETGPLAKRFMTFRASTAKLEQAQRALGLNVIAETTFGALSESELQFALAKALPTDLEGEELKAWVSEAIRSKRKLMQYLSDYASFREEGGTKSQWGNMMLEKGMGPQGQDVGGARSPDALPDPSGHPEGARAINESTGQVMVIRDGAWVAQ